MLLGSVPAAITRAARATSQRAVAAAQTQTPCGRAGFEANAGKFFWFFMVMILTLLYWVGFGIFNVHVTPAEVRERSAAQRPTRRLHAAQACWARHGPAHW